MFELAAEQGHAESQLNLGLMYYDGNGIKRNYEKAADMFKRAAIQGDSSAQYHLGRMHHNGDGMQKDTMMACHWWEKAASQQFIFAISKYNRFCLTGQVEYSDEL